ncbi:uncharacterized protein LOC124896174 [Capsicum annuum]|uniref:uncharacterized protein LOC124896174 n=1 Tax=Capsicum annuum TaxID=4072 RepID=UPI001FB09980|nr:uncharacterized protein LOC124896174 [Capsicum annuum]
MNGEFSSKFQLVDSHSTSIKYLEQQMNQISVVLNQRKSGTFLSDMVENPQNDGSCMVIATHSGKVLLGLSVGKSVIDNMVEFDEKKKGDHSVESKKLDNQWKTDELEKDKGKKGEAIVKLISKPLPPFPYLLKNKLYDTKFSKFMAMQKQLTVNMPLVEALEQMLGYAKFMKDFVTKKRTVSYELVDNFLHCSIILTRSLVQIKVYHGAFTIPSTIRSLDIAKALCDLRASINLVPLVVYKNLGLGDPTPTNMRLVMADRSVKQLVGILYDMLVKVDSFILFADFVILDCEVDFEVPIILFRPFLKINIILIDLRAYELKFRINDEVVQFDIYHSMKQHKEMSVFSIVYVYFKDEREVPIEEKFIV